jgi:hypothetical protein
MTRPKKRSLNSQRPIWGDVVEHKAQINAPYAPQGYYNN